MLIFLGLCIFITIYLYLFRESFIAELAISFLPYIIGGLCIIIAILIFLIIWYKFKRTKFKSLHIFFSIFLLILACGIGYLYSTEYFSFYNQPANTVRLVEDGGIKVFYANILYKNANFNALQRTIEEKDPDIVILVEFSDAHEDELKDFFRERYPYMNRNSWSTMLAGDVVFSKIPLTNITETHLVETGAWNYSYMQINLADNELVDLYVIHTAAPISYKNFDMRNNQISKLKSDFQERGKDSGNPVIIIGDFNISPRSYYYKNILTNLHLYNALSFQKPTYTWSLLDKGVFRSHIDQLFISDGIQISEVMIENLVGSDHRSFSFYFNTKS